MSAVLPDDLLLPDDDLYAVDVAGDDSPPVIYAPARSGRVADPRTDGIVIA